MDDYERNQLFFEIEEFKIKCLQLEAQVIEQEKELTILRELYNDFRMHKNWDDAK